MGTNVPARGDEQRNAERRNCLSTIGHTPGRWQKIQPADLFGGYSNVVLSMIVVLGRPAAIRDLGSDVKM